MKIENRHRGFTLLEAMIVVILLAILATMAYPSFKATLANNRTRAASSDFAKALSYTRTEAISRNKRIGLCPIGGKRACGSDWSKGFFVFNDSDGDKAINNNKDILQTYHLKEPINITSSTPLTALFWLPGGIRLESNGGINNTTFTFNPSPNGKDMTEQNKKCRLAKSGRLICS